MRVFTYLSVVLSFILATAAESHQASRFARKRHAERILPEANTTHWLEKRFDNARFSFYAAGTGACGKVNSATDFIVALNSAQYGTGSYCFQMITISYGGKTTQAQIVDECMGCPYGGLDFSTSLFTYFASESAGIIYGEWTFSSGASSSTSQPSSTSTWTPPATTSSTAASHTTSSYSTSSTTTSTTTTTTTSTSSTTSSVSLSSSSPSSSTTYTTTSSAAAETVGAMSNSDAGNDLNQLNLALLGMGALVISGSEVTS